MKFVVITIHDGGAEADILPDEAAVEKLLAKEPVHWVGALRQFENTVWRAGMAMHWPCGWIFAVRNAVDIE